MNVTYRIASPLVLGHSVLFLVLAGTGCSSRGGSRISDGGVRAGADAGTPLVGNVDSDHDGLPDSVETMLGTDPANTDSDGDGISDLAETEGSHTDPLDPHSTIPGGDFFVVLPYGAPAQSRNLLFGTRVDMADVYFLVDTTGSMNPAIANLRDSLTHIVERISMDVRSVQTGVGHFEDFPTGGGGFTSTSYGDTMNVAYDNLVDIGADTAPVLAAIGTLDSVGGGDQPEADVEALYQTATGEGGSWTFDYAPPYAIARKDCLGSPDDMGARRGYPCFRPGALPIVVHITDSPFHNQPGGGFPYMHMTPLPHTFADATDAMLSIGARYIGVAIDGGDRTDAEAMARATGTVDATGTPLVYDAARGSIGDSVIMGVETLVNGVPEDVSTRTRNAPGNPEDFDATQFIASIVTVEGYNGSASGPMPGITYDHKDDGTFYQLIPGTTVEFTVTFRNTVRHGMDSAQIFVAQIMVVGNGVATLSVRQVYVIVPPDGYEILI